MVLRWVLKNWLRKAAQDQLYDTLGKAAQSGEPTANAGEEEGADLTCDVAVVFATAGESGGFEDRLTGIVKTHASSFVVKVGTLGGRGVAIVETGRGRSAATSAAVAIAKGHQPRFMIAAGFASALSGDVAVGDVLMVEEIVGEDDRRLSLDLNVRAEDVAKVPRTRVGRLVSLDKPVRGPDEKAQLGRDSGALAADRESLGVAEACRQLGVPFMAVRVIIDAVDEPLCAELDPRVQARSTARRLGNTVGALVNRPGSIKEMVQEKTDLLAASDRLGRFLESIVVQLVPARE